MFATVLAASPDLVLDMEAFVERSTEIDLSQPLASPEPVPQRGTDASPAAALALGDSKNLLVTPLSKSMKGRALSHAGHAACSDDCPNHPVFGSVIGDGFCDDGAPSSAYCADPSGDCRGANTDFCEYGHDCTDCGPRILPEASNICKCCAVLFHGSPGSWCKRVPLWELDGWSCPDCNEDLPAEVLCDRVVFNFRSISNLDTQSNEVSKPNGKLDRDATREGRMLAGGARRVGYYIDEICATEHATDPDPSPLPFVGQDLMRQGYDPEKIIFQVGVPPPPPATTLSPPPPLRPPPPAPPPTPRAWCCGGRWWECRNALVEPCAGCRSCSKDEHGNATPEKCHSYFESSSSTVKACVWQGGVCQKKGPPDGSESCPAGSVRPTQVHPHESWP